MTTAKKAPTKLSADEIEMRRKRRIKMHRQSYELERRGAEPSTDWNAAALDDAMEKVPHNVAATIEWLRDLAERNEAEHSAFLDHHAALQRKATEAHTAATQLRRDLEYVEAKNRTPDQYAKLEQRDKAAEAASARVKAHRWQRPAYDPRPPLAEASRIRTKQREVKPDSKITEQVAFHEGPLEAAAAIGEEVVKAKNELFGVFDALQPLTDGVEVFRRALLQRRASDFNYDSLLHVEHGVDGRPLASSVTIPDSVIHDAVQSFAISHCERMLDDSVARAKAQGRKFLSAAERRKRVNALREKIAKLEAAEGCFYRAAIAQGLSPNIRPELPSAALLGIAPESTTRAKAVYQDVSNHAVRALN